MAVSALSTSRAEKLAERRLEDYIDMFENLPISVVGNTLSERSGARDQLIPAPFQHSIGVHKDRIMSIFSP